MLPDAVSAPATTETPSRLPGGPAPQRVLTALFVDFDNIYIGLQNQDVAAAEAFATNPGAWLRWLEQEVQSDADAAGTVRSILVRRCYLNPQSFGRYRPYFVRAGFQVVDCPPLTQGGKNGADIQMVMDVLDALEHRTRFEEFILLSGDSDFTPVLLRLRAHDRRTMILAVGFAAVAYRAACDVVLTEEIFIERALQMEPLLAEGQTDQPRGAGQRLIAPQLPDGGISLDRASPRKSIESLRREAATFIRTMIATSNSPIVSATVAQRLLDKFGQWLLDTNWAGTGNFHRFIDGIDNPGFSVSWTVPGYFYDPARHTLPESSQLPVAPISDDPQLNVVARRIHDITDVPLLTREKYAAVFEEVAKEIDASGYNLTGTSRAVRDRLSGRSVPVARGDVSFILKGITYGGYPLVQTQETHSPSQLAAAFLRNVFNLSQQAQLTLSDEECELITTWIGGESSPVEPGEAAAEQGRESGG